MRTTLDPNEAIVIRRHLAALRVAGCTEGTIAARGRALRRLRRTLGVPLLKATPRRLEDWAAGCALRLSVSGLYGEISHAKCFYAWAATAGLVKSSPAAALPSPRLPRRLPRPIAEGDLQTVLAGAPPRIRPWLALAGAAGLRAQEIAWLRREDVLDTAEPPVLIVSERSGKGRTSRVVPLSPWLLEELRPYLGARGWVFRRRDGKRGPVSPWLVSHRCGEAIRAAGVTATLHQLRHRFATVALDQPGANLRIVQELLGHANPATTAIYTQVSAAQSALVVAGMPCPA